MRGPPIIQTVSDGNLKSLKKSNSAEMNSKISGTRCKLQINKTEEVKLYFMKTTMKNFVRISKIPIYVVLDRTFQ